MADITRAQAVEAAKRVRELIQQYARPDYYHFLLDPVGQQTDPTKRAKEAMVLLDTILSAPAPSCDATGPDTHKQARGRERR